LKLLETAATVTISETGDDIGAEIAAAALKFRVRLGATLNNKYEGLHYPG